MGQIIPFPAIEEVRRRHSIKRFTKHVYVHMKSVLGDAISDDDLIDLTDGMCRNMLADDFDYAPDVLDEICASEETMHMVERRIVMRLVSEGVLPEHFL